MNEDFQICVQCNSEFDYNLEGHVTEGYIYSCGDCTMSMLSKKARA